MPYLEITSTEFRTWLEYHNFSVTAHSNNTGRIGEWERSGSNGYTDETLLQFDTSSLLFSTVTNVDLEFVSGSQGGQSGSTTLNLYKQDKTDYLGWSSTPRFDDFAQSLWSNLIATLSVQNTGTYTILDTTAFRSYVQEWIDFNIKNNGLIMSVDWGQINWYLSVDSVKLKITYTLPPRLLWGQRYFYEQSTLVNWCRIMGGVSPNLDDMTIKAISFPIGSTHIDDIRLGVYTGGSLSNPVGASLLYDFGMISGSGINRWYTIEHPGAGVAWSKNTNTWLAHKANGGTTYATWFTDSSRVEDFQSARGRWDSSSMSKDESTAFESSIPSGGAFANWWYPFIIHYVLPGDLQDKAFPVGMARGLFRGL